MLSSNVDFSHPALFVLSIGLNDVTLYSVYTAAVITYSFPIKCHTSLYKMSLDLKTFWNTWESVRKHQEYHLVIFACVSCYIENSLSTHLLESALCRLVIQPLAYKHEVNSYRLHTSISARIALLYFYGTHLYTFDTDHKVVGLLWNLHAISPPLSPRLLDIFDKLLTRTHYWLNQPHNTTPH